mmetsp:Transcript_33081/g.53647  ORF Transcript_33081/g.53647 Transcript_33081/m.53647 type:complete len:219 (-) Transcript_33081:79-735(-)
MHTFALQNFRASEYAQRRLAYFPRVISTFSHVDQAELIDLYMSPASCPTFKRPLQAQINLNNISVHKRRKVSDEHGYALDSILLACFNVGACYRNISGEPLVDFVSFRNNFNKIMKTPYQRRRDDAWRIHLHRLHGIVFMNICDIREDTNVDPNNWGPRFEKLCTSNVPLGFLEYCTVVRSELGPHRLLLGAEIDCVGDLHRCRTCRLPCLVEPRHLS